MVNIYRDTKKPLEFVFIITIIVIACLSFFNPLNIISHVFLFFVLAVIAHNLHLDKLFPMIVLDVIVVIMVLLAQKFGTGFNDPITHAFKFYYLTQAYTVYLIFSELDVEYKKKCINISVICLVITALVSIGYNSIFDPLAIRFRPPQYRFICSFGQYYAVAILVSSLLFRIIMAKNNRVLLAIIMFVFLYLFLIGNLVTGLVLTVLGIGLVLLTRIIKKTSVLCASVGIVVCLAYMFKSIIASIFFAISELSLFNQVTTNKIQAIANLLIGDNHIDSLSTRNVLIEYSLNSFRNNPILGIGYKTYGYGTIGCHQEWPDLIGVFGVLGVCLILVVYILVFINILHNTKNDLDRSSFIIANILFLLLGFVNPSVMECILMVIIVISPNISLLFCDKKQELY